MLGISRFGTAMAFIAAVALLTVSNAQTLPDVATDPAAYVDPLIGTANGGNTFPSLPAPIRIG